MDKKKIDVTFWDEFEKKVDCSLVPRFSQDTVRPCTEEDFQDYTFNLENNLRRIISMLDDLLQNEGQWTTKTKKHLTKVLVIVGEQHIKNAWNTSSCIELSNELISRLCRIFKHESVTEIIKDDDTFVSVLMFLRPRLLNDTWKFYPAAVICYKWLLECMKKPLLKRHVPEILPTALIIFDDYVAENQAFGLDCINIIIEHCQKSRCLRNLNHDEVIYQALEKMMYKVTPELIVPLYACISNLLENMELCNDSGNKFGWTKYDEVLIILLDNMELQSKFECRYAYAVSLKKFLKFSNSGKQIKRLARILSEYCENTIDLKTTDVALDLVKMLMSTYKPINVNFYSQVYSSLLKLCLELSLRKNVNDIHDKACECINLLNESCPHVSKEILDNDVIRSVVRTT
ncbi:TELO2-interacting protein 2-like [Copidosoma floridanum]|uniref:TELO2-interacting protein 2-like n=1 Tax=Copidosoma floridanum TaxID=29053 RepID=UPI0006C95800|nr:TELO2-interacting protein 2-like [Copidosoma floridanum]